MHGGERFHYKARFYHPKLGRFLQTDPIFYEDQMNMYAYVYNDPMNVTDPSGKSGWWSYSYGEEYEEVHVEGERIIRNNSCGCTQLTGQQAQDFVNAMGNALTYNMQMTLAAAAWMMSEANDSDVISGYLSSQRLPSCSNASNASS